MLLFFPILGIGLFLSSLFIFFSDLNQIWDVLLNILFYTSPIIYPLSIVPDYLMTFYMFNPVIRLVIIYRDIIVLGALPSSSDLIIVAICAVRPISIGKYVFNRLQRRFPEKT